MIHQIFLFHVAFSPLEPNFRKVAENFDNFFKGVMKKGGLNDIATNGGRRVVFNPKRGKLPITKYLQICTEKCTSNGNYYYNFECDRDDKMNVKANSWVLRWHCHLRLIVLRESEGKKSFGRSIDSVTVPLVEISRDSVVKTALAGGISCSFSTLLMHPIDTVKTQVQASSTLSFTEILSKLPQLGFRGLYMGSIPAIVGQFVSHGLRTGICEASKVVLINAAPSLPEIQAESIASFLGTFMGTTIRIPCEVLKQRLQAGQFNHVGEALVGTWQQDGLGGFFRGTGMTLCRELPFYVAGSSLYAQSKKAVQKVLGRELEPWETIAVGAVSGGLTAVLTTPFDVIKTRMMTAIQGQPTAMSVVALCILREEGPLGLFRGALPRFFWVAPLGAINFAGYELIRKAMD